MTTKPEVAFITGGGGAIGYGLAHACLERGWRVALVDISEKAMAEMAAKLGAPADLLATIMLDVSDFEAWSRAADEAETRLGEITYLFSNAGVTSGRATVAGGNIENLSVEEWRWTNSINYDGVFYGLKTFVPRFKSTQRRTHISTTASTAAVAALNTKLPLSYAASKAAVAHMTAQLRTELARQNVTSIGLSVIYPGRVTSNLNQNSLALGPGDGEVTVADITEAQRPMGIAPELIGRYVLRSIDRGDFHIFTHPEWGDNFSKYRSELDASYKEGADPSFTDSSISFVDITHAAPADG